MSCVCCKWMIALGWRTIISIILVGCVCQLRFPPLHGLQVLELPESIGELESLQTLDIRRAYVWQEILLPVSFDKLGSKLVRLLSERVKLPDGLALHNMKSLRELVGILVTLHAVSKIGKLRGLKVLGFGTGFKNSHKSDLELIPKCLEMCPSLQVSFIVLVQSCTRLSSGFHGTCSLYPVPILIMAWRTSPSCRCSDSD